MQHIEKNHSQVTIQRWHASATLDDADYHCHRVRDARGGVGTLRRPVRWSWFDPGGPRGFLRTRTPFLAKQPPLPNLLGHRRSIEQQQEELRPGLQKAQPFVFQGSAGRLPWRISSNRWQLGRPAGCWQILYSFCLGKDLRRFWCWRLAFQLHQTGPKIGNFYLVVDLGIQKCICCIGFFER